MQRYNRYTRLNSAAQFVLLLSGFKSLLYFAAISQACGNEICFDFCDDNAECFSITELPSKVSQLNDDNTTNIQMCSEIIELRAPLRIKGLRNVSINGVASKTIVDCTGFNEGFQFIEVDNLVIANLNIKNCGLVYYNSTTVRKTSIHILKCTNVFITNIIVSSGNGSGIVFNNTLGYNKITNSIFANNTSSKRQNGGGIYVEFNCTRGHECGTSDYTFQDCRFLQNKVSEKYISNDGVFAGAGRGGGMMIIFRGNSSRNSISILDCLYQGNRAAWGGGVNVIFADSTTKNRVTINDTEFRHNNCTYAGGGIDIGLTWLSHINEFFCKNCTFEDNSARIGGGTAVYAVRGSSFRNTTLVFKECKWIQNSAQYGAAVDLTPQHVREFNSGETPEPIFENCKFLNNTVKGTERTYLQNNGQLLPHCGHGRGTFFMTDFNATFIGKTEFSGNKGSALYAISSDIQFATGSVSEFESNTGTNGGAIVLIGLSAIIVTDNVRVILTNNTAVNKGGAIYYFTLDSHDDVFSYNCFIKYSREYSNLWNSTSVPNVSFSFNGNRVENSISVGNITTSNGNSIYATTILPCFRMCKIYKPVNKSIQNSFSCVGRFTFHDPDLKISTSSSHFNVIDQTDFQTPLEMIPGKIFRLPLELLDDFNQTVIRGKYRISIQNLNRSTISVADSDAHISQNRLQLYGNIGDTGIITLTTTGFREVSISFEVKMQECPPLFFLETDSSVSPELLKCVCRPSFNVSYIGLHKCHNRHFRASLRHGHWVGYTENETTKYLLYGYCPNTYCFNGLHSKRYHKLTTKASKELLDTIVCGESRTGIVCGECRDNYSVHYHSPHFECGQNHLCEIGWLLYAISELLPLTLLFILVIVFDISFTSGPLNGFIFFAQVFDSIFNNDQGFILYPYSVHDLQTVARVIYKLFNFDFFNAKQLSYCLWKGATTLDVLAFKFLTVVYALALVFVTIWLTDRFGKCCNRKKTRSTVARSITHGLSAFLVMVHAQCTTVSFKILQLVRLSSHGSPSSHKTVVFYQGNIDYFSPKHLAYAFPALLCIMTLVAIPPFLLLVYPLCNKIISFLKLDNWKVVSWMSRKIPMVRLKPMIDAFQGCFKDEYRYFAGLYFVYRIAFIACTFANRLTQVYTILELLLITVLVVHAFTWPYEKHWHNRVDGLIIFNLAVINSLSLFCYIYAQFGSKYQQNIDIASSVQLVFIYAPLVYILVYAMKIVIYKMNCRYAKGSNELLNEVWRDEDLPARLQNLQDLSDTESETDYQLHNDSEHNYTDIPHKYESKL